MDFHVHVERGPQTGLNLRFTVAGDYLEEAASRIECVLDSLPSIRGSRKREESWHWLWQSRLPLRALQLSNFVPPAAAGSAE
jgi:hypothetical protein